MRPQIALGVIVALVAAACSRSPAERTYALHGQVLAVASDRMEATIKHEEVEGLMPAMTMTYKVKDARLYAGVAPGDLIDATLVVEDAGAYFSRLAKVGEAPLETPPPPAASSGFELLKPGEAVPDATFVDQDGRERTFRSLAGGPLAITFIYTACPLPDFCPLMDRHFVTVQEALERDPALRNAHLVSISFDPITDTPAVLKKHATGLGADPARWTFLTGDRDAIDQFAARFGVSINRSLTDPLDIAHNLRTAVVDGEGRLVTTYTGNQWTPEQVIADLKTLEAAR